MRWLNTVDIPAIAFALIEIEANGVGLLNRAALAVEVTLTLHFTGVVCNARRVIRVWSSIRKRHGAPSGLGKVPRTVLGF